MSDGCWSLFVAGHYWDNVDVIDIGIFLFLASGHENVNIYSSSCPHIWFSSDGHLLTGRIIPLRLTPYITLQYMLSCSVCARTQSVCEHLNVLWWDKREKVTVRRIFYNVNKSHQGQILCRYFLPHVRTKCQVLNVMLCSRGCSGITLPITALKQMDFVWC